MRMHLFFILAGLILVSCSADKQTGEQSIPAPGVETSAQDRQDPGEENTVDTESILKISPETAFRDSTFLAFAERTSLDDKEINWFINGDIIDGESGIRFSHADLNKGDTVHAAAVIKGEEIMSNSVIIDNSPPRVTNVVIGYDDLVREKRLDIDVKWSDIDNDDVRITYEWTKNGEPGGRGEKIEGAFKRGDLLEIRIISFDGEDFGEPVLLTRKIENLPPMIMEDLPFNFDGKVYSYQVMAVDPDGDALTYSIASGKEEIKIGPQTGLIIWNVPDDFTGDVPITVSVKDGNGGESTQVLTISIQNEEIKQVRGGQ